MKISALRLVPRVALLVLALAMASHADVSLGRFESGTDNWHAIPTFGQASALAGTPTVQQDAVSGSKALALSLQGLQPGRGAAVGVPLNRTTLRAVAAARLIQATVRLDGDGPEQTDEGRAIRAEFVIAFIDSAGSNPRLFPADSFVNRVVLRPRATTTVVGLGIDLQGPVTQCEGWAVGRRGGCELGLAFSAGGTSYNGMAFLDDVTIVTIVPQLAAAPARQCFRATGGRLLDARGVPFLIRGVNNPHIWHDSLATNALSEIQKSKANTVRIVWDRTGDPYRLRRIVQMCYLLQLVPMIEMHDLVSRQNPARDIRDVGRVLMPYWTDSLADVLRPAEGNMLLNIANEAGTWKTTPDEWFETYRAAVLALRAKGLRTTLVIDAPGYAQDVRAILSNGPALIDADPEHNILFDFHFFDRRAWGDSARFESVLHLLQASSLPFVFGQIGPVPDQDHHLPHLLRLASEGSFGYIAWSWSGNEPGLERYNLVDARTWAASDLTDWGRALFQSSGGIEQTAVMASVFQSSTLIAPSASVGRRDGLSIARLGPGHLSFRLSATAPHPVRLHVLDPQGRTLARLAPSPAADGGLEVTWAPASPTGGRLPAGVYIVSPEHGGATLAPKSFLWNP